MAIGAELAHNARRRHLRCASSNMQLGRPKLTVHLRVCVSLRCGCSYEAGAAFGEVRKGTAFAVVLPRP